ncbi:hypothetical protein IFU08_00980 [Microbacterium sp. CFBP 8790]|uniref:hypothetical protein n=1 Tax=Microbacterium sp. CFBP 8790 TaxID=2775271 RepID=UPI0017872DCD|nr:hypothetical protein [Microbacterium sp. CFBP 8790]MBD8205530.1 hypothetical protein [Microbacterium sp. CFBP 8801]MBD8508135.1 hypothetical protein [Microbacterium sp. CFBP 8790]
MSVEAVGVARVEVSNVEDVADVSLLETVDPELPDGEDRGLHERRVRDDLTRESVASCCELIELFLRLD